MAGHSAGAEFWPEIPTLAAPLTWRGARLADLPAIYALEQACDEFDGTENAGTLDQLSREIEDPWLGNLAHNTLLAVDAAGDAVAFARILANPEPTGVRRMYIRYAAHPAHREAGLEGCLLAWLEWRGRRAHEELDGSIPAVLSISLDARQRSGVRIVLRRGFEPDRYFYRMRRDLSAPLPAAALPDGLSLQTYSPDLKEALRAAHNEAFSGHWGYEHVDQNTWELLFVGQAAFRADLSFLALDGSEIAAYTMSRVDPQGDDGKLSSSAWIDYIATREPWRRRGVASALILITMRSFREHGIRYALLGVDADNPTGAFGLYERLGFAVYRRFVRFEKPLRPKA